MSFGRFKVLRASLLLVSLLAAGHVQALCGDGVREDGEACDDGNTEPNDACNSCRLSCQTIEGALVSHTCGHGAFGPFEQAAAQSYPGFVFADISSPHTYYTLTLSGDPGENRSSATYWPTLDSLYAFFLKHPYPFSVYSSTGAELPVVFEHDVSCVGMGSGSLTWVKVYELTAADPYAVVFGPMEDRNVSVAVERMPPPSPSFWDHDGDGRGGELAGLGSCQYDGPVVDVQGDCDDTDASIYPGAPERCDGIDSNCSGGEDTGAKGLCEEDGAGTACVAAGSVTRCGCTLDTHCAGAATCNAIAQRCETPSGAGGTKSGEGGRGEEGGGAGEVGVSAGGVAGFVSGAGGRGDAGETGTVPGAAGESAGTAGTSTDGSSGTGDSGAAATNGGAGGESAAPGSRDGPATGSGCGCRTASGGPASTGIGLVAAVFFSLLRRRLFSRRRASDYSAGLTA
jgi:MYXO-CTERM domain-containing protein